MENILKSYIDEYEALCNSCRADTDKGYILMGNIRSLFKKIGIEFCAHNAAFLGWKRYEKYLNKNLNRFVTIQEYRMLNLNQISNFENLTETEVQGVSK
jgi:hypothetical protein